MSEVIIGIEGGAAFDIAIPEGVKVIIRDYDIDQIDEDRWDIRIDDKGSKYQHIEL